MRTAVLAGVVLGALVVAWTFVMGFTGWYADPSTTHLFFLVVGVQVAVLVVTLQRTREGRGYGAQVGVGLLASAVAAVLIFVGSYLFTTVFFPEYFETLERVHEQMLRQEGLEEAEIRRQIEAAPGAQSPFGQAAAGFMGTLVTGLLVSLLAAILLRDRSETKPDG